MHLSAGESLGPYKIVGSLGAGGMGEVYRAHDDRIGRDVALKILPQPFTLDADRLRRFEQEARAAGALDHPNLVAIHDIGTHQGIPYIVMELLEGETLREKMGSPIPPRKAIEYAVQIASGLAAAHVRGIIHRDLKPENIFITRDGRVKILDFGLAKLRGVEEAGDKDLTMPRQTRPGAVFGSLSYMSPEQVRGEPADAPADIFSFGVILHEMLSRLTPFDRGSTAETMSAILRDDPAPDAAAGQLHHSLPRVVQRCLEKSPEERFQSARDVSFALQEIEGDLRSGLGSPVKPKRRILLPMAAVLILIAVIGAALLLRRDDRVGSNESVAGRSERNRIVILPFENLGDPTDAYFASGLTEEITSRLASVRDLGVISRTTAVEYSRKGKTLKQVGQDLGVDYVLEGTVRWDKAGNRVRITPQLVRVADDTHLWADRYDRDFQQIFDVQSDIAERVLAQLDITLADPERSAVTAVPTRNTEAYQSYLRALNESVSENRDLRDRIALLQRAVRLDPRFAVAHAILGADHAAMYHYGFDRTSSRLLESKRSIDAALAIDPSLPEARRSFGLYYYWGSLDYEKALEQFELARRRRPNDAELWQHTAAVHRRQGRFDEALRLQLIAQQLNPGDLSGWQETAWTYRLLRRPAEAEEMLVRSIAVAPEEAESYRIRVDNLWSWKGPTAEAREILQQMPDTGDEYTTLTHYEQALLDRRFEDALEKLKLSEHSLFHTMPVGGEQAYLPRELLIGQTYALLGQETEARKSLQAALEILEKASRVHPDNARIRGALAFTYAGLGRKADALREAEWAVRIYPLSKDALSGTQRLTDLAAVHASVGDKEKAIDLLEKLLTIPSFVTVPVLKHDPAWDPLRNHPRFQALLAG